MSEVGLETLVVDDEPDVLDTLRRMLSRTGGVVHVARSVQEALLLLDRSPQIGVLLADVNMPRADGFALARAALSGRTEDAALEIVFMTGLGTAENAVEAIRSQAFDFLTKPFRAAEFAAVVMRARESAANRRSQARRVAAGEVARQRAESARARLFSVISHELRTPLNPILGLSHMIAEDEAMSRERARDFARCIHREGAHLLRLIERSLAIVELDAGQTASRSPGVALDALIRRVVAETTSDGSSAASVRVVAEAEPVADCDEELIALAVQELLENARRAAPTDTVVRVECGAANGSVRLAVIDAGPGFPESILNAEVHDFMQADMSETRAWSGAGLGLALVRRIAEAHDGTLSLSNGEAGGASAVLEW